MYQNGVKYLYTDCCFSDLELKKNPAYKRVGLVQNGHLHSPIVTCSDHYITNKISPACELAEFLLQLRLGLLSSINFLSSK